MGLRQCQNNMLPLPSCFSIPLSPSPGLFLDTRDAGGPHTCASTSPSADNAGFTSVTSLLMGHPGIRGFWRRSSGTRGGDWMDIFHRSNE